MSDGWPQEAIRREICAIMGTGQGYTGMPLSRLSGNRLHLGAVIVDKLGLATVDAPKLDELVEAILRATVDAYDANPKIMAARELLGLANHSDEDLARVFRSLTHSVKRSEVKRGYRSKEVRLYLAGQHQCPPIKARAARDAQEAEWAPAMAIALYHYLDGFLDEAKGIAADMGLRFRSDESSAESQGAPVESFARGTIDPMPGQLAQPSPLSLPPSHFLDFSERLEQALGAVLVGCEARGRRVYTFDVLLALLDMPAGQVRDCFDDVKRGLSDTVRAVLRAMPAPGKHIDPFVAPKWHLRPEIAQAWRYASESSRTYVIELDVLLAILVGSSGTNLWLKSHTLQDTHAQVRARVEQRRKNPDGDRSPVPD